MSHQHPYPPQETLRSLLSRQATRLGSSSPTDMLRLIIVLPSMQYLEDNLQDVMEHLPSDLVTAYADKDPSQIPKPTAWEMAPSLLEKVGNAMREISIPPSEPSHRANSISQPHAHSRADDDLRELLVETGGHFAISISYLDTTEAPMDNLSESATERGSVSVQDPASGNSPHGDDDDDDDELRSIDLQNIQTPSRMRDPTVRPFSSFSPGPENTVEDDDNDNNTEHGNHRRDSTCSKCERLEAQHNVIEQENLGLHQRLSDTLDENALLRAAKARAAFTRPRRDSVEGQEGQQQFHPSHSESGNHSTSSSRQEQGEQWTNDRYRVHVQELKARIETLEEAAVEADKSLKDQNAQIVNHQRENKRCLARIAALEAENQNLREEVDARTSELGEMADELGEKRRELTHLKKKMEENEAEEGVGQGQGEHQHQEGTVADGNDGILQEEREEDAHPVDTTEMLLRLIPRGQVRISDSRRRGRGYQYLVVEVRDAEQENGDGSGRQQDEGDIREGGQQSAWIAASKFRNEPLCRELVQRFHTGHPDKPKPEWVTVEG
ncbi:hypothetical protein HD806DRAFT_551051 [Xylariaceae sp. AK1471]|nr:hypothetical protein HD806DRAFT_551051 [Xylariaceae sp. AK1471]